ncbi:PhnD/SsuA/transferrin family substrate-binding protein [Euhalothece natronophila Z-M001]|uniref:PhnD/SsuA/transferrin family substrate-binding protein n=1 Tax=Euhalothece natronophila Z-M001 TaxID=522448 RepID=A0A5B8NKB9_9CHRO|nr:PhnD/SsuA/transferrin family substrate-binding protein [Euhalothece natronophila]QDZ39317.1 PhnD/SsuA/transferrin family substrate-binding protein [Euhalothece natronophila Z-M001]
MNLHIQLKTKRLAAVTSALAVLIASCNGGGTGGGEMTGAGGACPDTLRFADTGTEGMEELRRDFEEFQSVMAEILEVEFEFFAVSDRTIGAAAVDADQVDILLAGPAEYVAIGSRVDINPVVGIRRPGYNSNIVVLPDSDIEDPDDLHGKDIALKDAGSTSGHIGPLALIEGELGIDPETEVNARLLGDARIEAFIAGDVDAFAAGTSDIRRLDERYGEDSYRMLVEGPDLPSDVIMTSDRISEECNEEILERVLDNEEEVLDALFASDVKYEDSSLHSVTDDEYDVMRDAFRAAGYSLEDLEDEL